MTKTANLFLAVFLTASALTPPAFAAEAAAARLTLSPTSATPGTKVTATGTGFSTVGNQIRILVGRKLVATIAYQPPDFSTSFVVPELPPNFYTVTACVARAQTCLSAPGTSAQARLRVLAPPRPSPSARPSPSTPAPRPSGPGELQVSMDPLCCDPPAPSNPVNLVGPASPTPGPAFENPGAVPSFPDLYLLGIEVTQNVQDVSSKMPLVAGRKTWIRVHPRANTGSWAPIDGAILVKHSGNEEIIYPVNGPIATGLTVDRADTDSALNFALDPKWYSEGTLNITALVWAFSPSTLDDKEPNPENNLMTTTVNFKVAKKPNVHVVPLDDGAGPGPSPTLAWTVFSSLFVSNNIVRYHPIAETNLTLYPVPVSAGTGSGGIGLGTVPAWNLTTSAGRTQPLQKLFWYHQVLGLPEDERLFGIFDSSIPSGGYSGWAKSNLKSAWTKPSGTTPSHEAGHLTGLKHVDCVGTEEDGGALDPTHPNAAPNCSLAPVDKSGFFGLTVYDTPFTIYSNDPDHPQAAFPLMSYAGTKWNDAYHWCKMLTYYEVPCSPEAIGVPGVPIPNPTNVNVDCDESVTGPGGIAMMVCLTDPSAPDYDNYPQLPPNRITMAVPAQPQAWLLVSGVLSKDGGTITQAALVDKLAPSLAALAAEDEAAATAGRGGSNELVVADSAGGVLARVKVGELGSAGEVSALPVTAHGDGGSHTSTGEFAKVIPIAGDVASIKLLAGGKAMATEQISEAAPTIGNLTAAAGGAGVRISWSVNDPDGDPVTSTVLWSADGESWLPVALDTAATSVLVGSAVQLPGGPAVRVKVIANDGVRISEAISSPFSMAGKAPLVAIGELPDGSTIPRYYVGDLSALGYDPEDGHLAGTAISWRSDLDGELGTGAVTSIRRLSAGEHTITATATDSTGATGSDTIRLVVVDTGASAPRLEGANPDAEWRLRAGSAVASSFSWIWMVVAAAAAIAVLAGVWFTLRRRRVTVQAEPTSAD